MSKIFNKWVKSEAELISGGLTKTSLINDTKIYVTGNSINKRLDEAITDGDIGGGGGINHVTNNEMASNIIGYNTYKDAVDIIPENGTAGTATVISISRNTTTPLRNLADLKIAKSGSNGKGEGVSYDVAVDLADQSQVMELSFDYRMTSGYADNDFSIFLFDVTNNVLIRFNGEELKAKSPYGKFIAFPQLSANSTSYRIIFHCVSTSTTAYDLFIDNVKLGPSNDVSLSNTNISPWTSYTPTFTGLGTVTSPEIFWRRVGEDIEIAGSFITGIGTATEARISLPNGYTSSGTSKITSLRYAGQLVAAGSSTAYFSSATLIEPSVTYLTLGRQTTAINALTKSNGDAWASSIKHSFNAKVPVTAFTAADTTSAEYSGRFITATMKVGSTKTITSSSSSKVDFDTVSYDSASMANTSSKRIDIKESGFYNIDIGLGGTSQSTNERVMIDVRLNGTTLRRAGTDTSGGGIAWSQHLNLSSIQLIKGDYLEVFSDSATDISYTVEPDSDLTWFTVTRMANPVDVVKSNETIFVFGKSNTNQNVSANTVNIPFTEVSDSHDAWDGSLFTAPKTADYIFDGSIRMDSSAVREVKLYVDTVYNRSLSMGTYGLSNFHESFNGIIRLTKGQTMGIRLDTTSTVNNSVPEQHHITIRSLN